MGAAVFGALFGPVVGAAAALLGRDWVFTGLAGLSVVPASWTIRLESIPPEPPSWSAMARALRNNVFVGGLVLIALPYFLYRVLSTLPPLHLSPAGRGEAAVGAVWLDCVGLSQG